MDTAHLARNSSQSRRSTRNSSRKSGQFFTLLVANTIIHTCVGQLLSPWVLCETYNGVNITDALQKQLISVAQCLSREHYAVTRKTALGMALHQGRISPYAMSNDVAVSQDFKFSDEAIVRFTRCNLHMFLDDGNYRVCFLQKLSANIALSKADAPWNQKEHFVPFTTLYAELSVHTNHTCQNDPGNESNKICFCQVQQQHPQENASINVFDDRCTDKMLSSSFGVWKQANASDFWEAPWQQEWYAYFSVQYALSKRWKYCALYSGDNISQALHDQLGIVTACFRQKGIPYYITYGTLLGIVRDGGINPYEVDNDIAIPMNFTITTQMYQYMEVFNLHLFMDGIPRVCYKAAQPHRWDAPWSQNQAYMVYSDLYLVLPYIPTELDYFDSGRNKSNLINVSYSAEEVQVGNHTVTTYDNVTARYFMKHKYKDYDRPPLHRGMDWKSYWHYRVANITPPECNGVADCYACTRVRCAENLTGPSCPGHCTSYCIQTSSSSWTSSTRRAITIAGTASIVMAFGLSVLCVPRNRKYYSSSSYT
eukprot:m.355195 g.355195  ORF g.355195 m.355195 type:complete len:538 (-) comp20733_c0_seq1:212-1825(-)